MSSKFIPVGACDRISFLFKLAIISSSPLSVLLSLCFPFGHWWYEWWIFCYCPTDPLRLCSFLSSLFSLLFRLSKFYYSDLKFTDSIFYYLHSTIEPIHQVYFSYCIFQFYNFYLLLFDITSLSLLRFYLSLFERVCNYLLDSFYYRCFIILVR